MEKQEKIDLIMNLVTNLTKYEWQRVSHEINQQYRVAENRVVTLSDNDTELLKDRLSALAITR